VCGHPAEKVTAGQPCALPALLELMQVLLQHQQAAAPTDQSEIVARSRARERELLPWIPRACETGRAATERAWWSAVLSLLEALVVREGDRPAPADPERALP
jgi:TorA maturation chaperone TorD